MAVDQQHGEDWGALSIARRALPDNNEDTGFGAGRQGRSVVTIVLGIGDSKTCGAALIVDGRIVAAVNEERLNRKKMCWGFPTLSIAEVLRIAGISPADVDRIAVAGVDLSWRPETVTIEDYFRKDKGGAYQTLLDTGSRFSTLAGGFGPARAHLPRLKALLMRERRAPSQPALRERHGLTAPVKFYDHHLCHAASAYFTFGIRRGDGHHA